MNIQPLRAQIAALQDATMDENRNFRSAYDEGKFEALTAVNALLDSLQEESVSKELNTESMIESYKQRLISQANGMKNSPLIDMCLVSYKHGINETLDTLNLSNVQRTVKNRKESISEGLEDAAFDYAESCKYEGGEKLLCIEHFKAGANRQFERVKEALLSEVLPCFMNGGEADEIVAKLEEVLNKK